MKQNVGSLDRALRILVGAALFFIAYNYLHSWGQVILYILGTVLIVTGIRGYCVLYKLFRFSTLDKSK
ncbi:DUF2892 domain-containing protein [archaeon]|nr:DUF2892 domain-containing protein [archaeon]